MTLTVIAIAELVEIDYSADNPLDTLVKTGRNIATVEDEDGNRYTIDTADFGELEIGNKILVQFK